MRLPTFRWRDPGNDGRSVAESSRASHLLTWIDSHPPRALGVIVLLAFALAAPHFWIDRIATTSGETVTWWPIIDNVEDGRGYTGCLSGYFPSCARTNQVTAAREPAPVLLFAGLARLTHDSIRAAGLAQIALNLATVVGVFMLAREMANVRIALLAALIWALYLPPNRTEVGQVTGNLLATVCVAWGIFLFMRARRTGRVPDMLGAGAILGVGAFSRSALVVVPLGLALGALGATTLAIRDRAQVRRSLRSVGFFILAFSLMLCPWLVRNYAAFGSPVLGTTLTGYNLYRQNFLLPTGDYLHFVASAQAGDGIDALLARRTDLTGTETEAQMDTVYREEAMRIIEAHPGRYAALTLVRTLMLWFDWSVKKAYGYPYTAADYLVWGQQSLLLLAAIAGVRALRQRAWPLVSAIVAVTLLYMPVIGRLYLLIPVMPLTVVLSTVGCAHLATSLTKMPGELPSSGEV